jgi:hypothetical protein
MTVERIGPTVQAGCGERLVLGGAGRKPLQIPSSGVRMTENYDRDLLTLTKHERLRRPQDAVLVARFERTHGHVLNTSS